MSWIQKCIRFFSPFYDPKKNEYIVTIGYHGRIPHAYDHISSGGITDTLETPIIVKLPDGLQVHKYSFTKIGTCALLDSLKKPIQDLITTEPLEIIVDNFEKHIKSDTNRNDWNSVYKTKYSGTNYECVKQENYFCEKIYSIDRSYKEGIDGLHLQVVLLERNENGSPLKIQNLLEYSYIKDILPRLGIDGPEKDDDEDSEYEHVWLKYKLEKKEKFILKHITLSKLLLLLQLKGFTEVSIIDDTCSPGVHANDEIIFTDKENAMAVASAPKILYNMNNEIYDLFHKTFNRGDKVEFNSLSSRTNKKSPYPYKGILLDMCENSDSCLVKTNYFIINRSIMGESAVMYVKKQNILTTMGIKYDVDTDSMSRSSSSSTEMQKSKRLRKSRNFRKSIDSRRKTVKKNRETSRRLLIEESRQLKTGGTKKTKQNKNKYNYNYKEKKHKNKTIKSK